MRKIVCVAGLAAMLLLAVPGGFAAPAASKSGSGTIVIVFKDGHRQSYNLADVERVEFPGAGQVGSVNPSSPSRTHFLGKWECGDGNGGEFFISLYEDGQARKSIGNRHGTWVYVDGEARVSWDDGWQDAIRKVGSIHQKFAYSAGKSWNDTPDNVADAHSTSPKPI